MALSRTHDIAQDEPVHRLLAAGRGLLRQGETRFGIELLCARAGVGVSEFHALFADRRAFLEALVGQKESRGDVPDIAHRLNEIEDRLSALEESLIHLGPQRGLSRVAAILRRLARKGRMLGARLTPAPLARLLQRRMPVAAAALLILCAGAAAFGLSQRPHGIANATSLEALLNRAEDGDAAARSALAYAYMAGKIVPHEAEAAARWAQAAAAQGDGDAQYLIGSLLFSGDGIAADPQKAVAWFAKSAAQGNVKAMHNLAIAYVQGRGTAKNPAAAADWFARAAAQGYVDSAFDLAVLYEQGLGVKQDAAQALRWYRKAAEAGDRAAAQRAHFLETDGRP